MSVIDDSGGSATYRSPFFQDPTALTDKAIEKAVNHIKDDMLAQKQFLAQKVEGSIEIIKTRLDGNDTALVAALAAAGKAADKQTENFTIILDENKKGTTKQIDSLNDKIDDLKERMASEGGRSTGVNSTLVMGISVVVAVASVLLVVVTLSSHNAPQGSTGHVAYSPAMYDKI